jgi:hypothetical protein
MSNQPVAINRQEEIMSTSTINVTVVSEFTWNCARCSTEMVVPANIDPSSTSATHCAGCTAELARLFVQTLNLTNKKAQAQKKAEDKANALIKDSDVIDQTYNGFSGCACGCGGDYTEDGVNTGKAKARINKINKYFLLNPRDVYVLDCGDRVMYEITTSEGNDDSEFDRVTRVYVKKSI